MSQYKDAPLLPPITVLNERLTRNQRERYLLRTLLRLALREEQQRKATRSPRHEADGREGGYED